MEKEHREEKAKCEGGHIEKFEKRRCEYRRGNSFSAERCGIVRGRDVWTLIYNAPLPVALTYCADRCVCSHPCASQQLCSHTHPPCSPPVFGMGIVGSHSIVWYRPGVASDLAFSLWGVACVANLLQRRYTVGEGASLQRTGGGLHFRFLCFGGRWLS